MLFPTHTHTVGDLAAYHKIKPALVPGCNLSYKSNQSNTCTPSRCESDVDGFCSIYFNPGKHSVSFQFLRCYNGSLSLEKYAIIPQTRPFPHYIFNRAASSKFGTQVFPKSVILDRSRAAADDSSSVAFLFKEETALVNDNLPTVVGDNAGGLRF